MRRLVATLMAILIATANTQLVLAACGCPPVEAPPLAHKVTHGISLATPHASARASAQAPCHDEQVQSAQSVSTCCPVHDGAPAPARFDDRMKVHLDHAAVDAVAMVAPLPRAMLALAAPLPSAPPPLERPLYLLDCCFLK